MSVSPRLTLLLFAALLLAGGVAAAQQTPSSAPQPSSTTQPPSTNQQTPASTLHRRTAPPVRTIHLDVVVTRKDGKPVSGLQAKDFTLLDNKTPLPIGSFQAYEGEQAPVQVVMLRLVQPTVLVELSLSKVVLLVVDWAVWVVTAM